MRARVIASTALAGVLALAPLASAQTEVSGRLQHIEPGSRTLYFTDGRIVTLDPGATVWIDGRQVPIETLRDGMAVVIRTAQATPASPHRSPAASMAHRHAMSGTIASIDSDNRTVTFQDGRTLRLGPGARVWEGSDLDDIRAGEHVMIQGGELAGYAHGGQMSSDRMRTGTVVKMDKGRSMVLLDDGSWVRVTPGTRMHVNGREMVTELQPGDELIIVLAPAGSAAAPSAVTPPAGTVVAPAPSALPRESLQEDVHGQALQADMIHIFRRPQSP